MNVLLAKVGEELCNVVWQKTERGEDDRFTVDDLSIIFAAACAAAIRRSPDKKKAVIGAAEVLGNMLRVNPET